MQSGVNKTLSMKQAIPKREAKYMLEAALKIMGLDPQFAGQLILEDGTMTRGDLAYTLSWLIQQYDNIAIGNNLEFLRAIDSRTRSMTTLAEQNQFVVRLLAKLIKIPDATLERVGLHPRRLIDDLKAIAQ